MTLQTNTIIFRLALSGAGVWLAYTGYQSVTTYNVSTAASEAYRNDPARYEKCDYPVVDGNGVENLEWRNPTIKEASDCRKSYDDIYAKIEAEQSWWNKRVLERQAISSFFGDGVLPVGLLLLVAALWGKIATAGRSYVGWLKSGKAQE
ncbi:MAG: hypothetical protein JHD35_08170 [Sphingopyxis sp.]|nr:hypothetical protein [Sphingopyxis sp.]